ncbi:MAG: hypothetical protein K9N55_16965 [Phycisphaerae bacterium]|nr:hypothetical protein [Phycisphaerae bacterium]
MDRHVLDDAFAAMDKSSTLKRSRSNWTWHRSSTIRLAVAAMIIVAIGLLAIQWDPQKEVPSEMGPVAKSPADSLSVMSLNMAYRRGGIEAMDALAETAFDLPKSRSAKVSLRELLTESNGV